MWPLEPGPIVPETLPLGPRVVTPGTFLALAAGLVPVLDGSAVQADQLTAALAPHAHTDIDPTFDATLATAAAGLDALDLPSDVDEFATYGTWLDVIDEHSQHQRAETPAPDAPEPDLGIDGPVPPEPDVSQDEHDYWDIPPRGDIPP